jgi:hypothetical protein
VGGGGWVRVWGGWVAEVGKGALSLCGWRWRLWWVGSSLVVWGCGVLCCAAVWCGACVCVCVCVWFQSKKTLQATGEYLVAVDALITLDLENFNWHLKAYALTGSLAVVPDQEFVLYRQHARPLQSAELRVWPRSSFLPGGGGSGRGRGTGAPGRSTGGGLGPHGRGSTTGTPSSGAGVASTGVGGEVDSQGEPPLELPDEGVDDEIAAFEDDQCLAELVGDSLQARCVLHLEVTWYTET